MSIRRQFVTELTSVNLLQLSEALLDVLGASFHGLSEFVAGSSLAVDTESEMLPGQIAAVQDVIDAHVAVDYRARERDADEAAANIPNWATWTAEQALNWHDTNIATPLNNAPTVTNQNAVQVLQGVLNIMSQIETENRAMVQMILAMRNKLWPRLQVDG